MKKGRRILSGLILIASVLFSSLAQADFELKDSTLPIQVLVVEASSNIDGDYLKNSGAALRWDPNGDRYFFGYALGLPQYNRPDSLYSTVWEVVPQNGCIALKLFSLQEYRSMDIESMGSQKNDPFPPTGCVGFDSQCNSRDGKLQLTNVYEGTKKTRQRRGGWFGSEGLMDVTFWTGQQIFTITHIPSGEKVSVVEELDDSASYTEMDRRLKYIPELGVVILFGIRDSSGRLQSYCIKLPEENTSQSH